MELFSEERSPSVTVLVAGESGAVRSSQTGLLRAISIPARLFLWAQAPNIDLAPVTLMKNASAFSFFLSFSSPRHLPLSSLSLSHRFKSTYVISSSHKEKVAERYHLSPILQ